MLEDVRVRELLQREAMLDWEDIVAEWMLEADGTIVNMMDIGKKRGFHIIIICWCARFS